MNLYRIYIRATTTKAMDIEDFFLITARNRSFDEIEKFLLLKCYGVISIRSAIELRSSVDIARNMLRLDAADDWRRIISDKFDAILLKANWNFEIVRNGLILTSFQPFRQDVNGIILNRNRDVYSIRYIKDVIDDGDDNIVVAGYIPSDFLNELTMKVSKNKKKDLRVLIAIIYEDDGISKRLFNLNSPGKTFIGVSIPKFCKKNNLTAFKIYFGRNATAIDFGREYYDRFSYNKKLCFLHRLSFIGVEGGYYESIRERFCTSIDFGSVPIGMDAFPHHPCFDEHVNIPRAACVGNPARYSDATIECYDHPISNETRSLYDHAIGCLAESKCSNALIPVDSIRTYVDARLFLLSSHIPTKNADIYFDVVERALKMIADRGRITFLFEFLNIDAYYPNGNCAIDRPISRTNFLFYAFNVFSNDTIGFAVRTDGNFERISYEIAENASVDEDVQVALYFNRSSRDLRFDGGLTYFFVLYNRRLNAGIDCVTRSALLTAQTKYDLEFEMYLKASKREGFWSRIPIKRNKLTMVAITGEQEDACDVDQTCQVFEKDLNSNLASEKTHHQNILAHLTFGHREILKEILASHRLFFKIVNYVGAILSISGTFCVLISSLVLKRWYRKRFHIVQLSISHFCQAALSLTGASNLNHVSSLILYYSILAQFAWMMLFAYAQYGKFIQFRKKDVFGNRISLILGWMIPGLIVIIASVVYSECLRCVICSKTEEIFDIFVLVPISIVLPFNLGVYIVVMLKIWRRKRLNKEARRNRVKIAAVLPCLLGLTWFFVYPALIAPTYWTTLIVWYILVTVLPTQGFLIFVFLVVLDEDTGVKWGALLNSIFPACNGGDDGHIHFLISYKNVRVGKCQKE